MSVQAADTTLRGNSPFPFGASINTTLLKNNAAYRTTVAREFNSLTPENVMKMGPIHPSENTYSWANADTLVAFAQQNGQRVHGHALVWHNSLPGWMTNFSGDSAAWENMLKTHIQTVAGHFAGRLSSWDVVNEAFNDNGSLRSTIWLQHLGPDYIERCFRYAHAADPDVLLFYNDYGHEYAPAKLQAIDSLVRAFQQHGVPLHGVGLQLHINKNTSHANIANAIKVMVKTGLRVHVSELDIAMNPENNQSLSFTPALSQLQADKYNFIMRLYKTVPPAQRYGLTTWNVSDADSWIPGTYSRPDWPLLFDSMYRKKQAYQATLDGFSSLWMYDAASAQSISTTYSPLGNNGTAITTNFTGGALTTDNDNAAVQAIGFPFFYNGTYYQQFVLNTNGYIKLGTVAPSSASIFYATINANTNGIITAPDADVVYPYNHDLVGTATTEYRVYTSGAPGARVCTIQYKDVADKLAPAQYALMNFQVKLYEGTNAIEFVYGAWTASANASTLSTAALGIKGSYVNTSVNLAKGSTNSWSVPLSTANGVYFINGDYSSAGPQFNTRNTALPDAGRTFRFTVLDAAALLPLMLTSFSVIDNRSAVVLKWNTERESNYSGFEIQRSVNGWQFVTIGTVSAKGNASGSNLYDYVDRGVQTLDGTLYYRLVQISRDGKTEFSPAISIRRSSQQSKLTITGQNPFQQTLALQVTSAVQGTLLLQLVNIKGEQLWQKKVQVEAGSNLVSIPGAASLARGMYFIRGMVKGELSVLKIVKQ